MKNKFFSGTYLSALGLYSANRRVAPGERGSLTLIQAAVIFAFGVGVLLLIPGFRATLTGSFERDRCVARNDVQLADPSLSLSTVCDE